MLGAAAMRRERNRVVLRHQSLKYRNREARHTDFVFQMALFETSTQCKRWLLNVEGLESRRRTSHDKSVRSLVNPVSALRPAGPRPIFDLKECSIVYNSYLRALLALCKQLQLQPYNMPHTVLNSAAEFFRRVYIDRSVMDLHPEHAMRACVFLACKVDNYRGHDQGLGRDPFVQVGQHTKNEIADPNFGFANAMPNAIKAMNIQAMQSSQQPLEMSIHLPAGDVLRRAELMVLEVIGFDLHVYSTRRVVKAIIFDLCEELKSKDVASAGVSQHVASELKSLPLKPLLKVTPVLADDFRNKLRGEVEALLDDTLPGDASLLLPPIQIAERCLRDGLKKCFTQFKDTVSRPDPMISKFAPILEQSANFFPLVDACFSKHKIKTRDLLKEDCRALLPLPLPSESELPRAVKRNLYPTLNLDDLRQTADLMLRWESARNPEFDLDSEYYTEDRQDHDDSYQAQKIKLRAEARQLSSMDHMTDGLIPQPLDGDDEDGFIIRGNIDQFDPGPDRHYAMGGML